MTAALNWCTMPASVHLVMAMAAGCSPTATWFGQLLCCGWMLFTLLRPHPLYLWNWVKGEAWVQNRMEGHHIITLVLRAQAKPSTEGPCCSCPGWSREAVELMGVSRPYIYTDSPEYSGKWERYQEGQVKPASVHSQRPDLTSCVFMRLPSLT